MFPDSLGRRKQPIAAVRWTFLLELFDSSWRESFRNASAFSQIKRGPQLVSICGRLGAV